MGNEDPPRRCVIIYCRISDDREGRQAGVGRQEAECRKRAKLLGWEVVDVYIENDLSAYSGKPRPLYAKLLDDLRSGRVNAVLALAPTRLYRQIRDASEFLDLVETHGIAVETVKAGRYNLSTADGRRDARRAAVDNQYESELISERVRDAKAETLAAGGYRGGPRPYGFEGDGVIIREEEAAHIRAATNAVIAGESLRSICRDLAAAGARTVPRRYRQEDGTKGEPTSREWTPEELRKLLLRPRNAGLIEHRGEIVGTAVWDALVDEETWRACKGILDSPERRTTTTPARKWLGAGLFRCGVCGGPLKSSSTGRRARDKKTENGGVFHAAYRCRKPGDGVHVSRVAAQVDEYVEHMAVERLKRPDAHELLLPPAPDESPRENLAKVANALRAKLDEIAEDYAHDRMTRKQANDSTAFVRKRLEQIDAQMAARSSASILASLPLGTEAIAEQWDGFHLDKKREILNALMTVTIMPAKRGRPAGYRVPQGGKPGTYFDDSTIKIDWKDPT